ncbi:MAG: hypothetical protein V4534_06660 [Myxococcota bacterium]
MIPTVFLILTIFSIHAIAQQVLAPGRSRISFQHVNPDNAPPVEYAPANPLAEHKAFARLEAFDWVEFYRLDEAVNSGRYLTVEERWRYRILLVQFKRLETQFDLTSYESDQKPAKSFHADVPGVRTLGCGSSKQAAESAAPTQTVPNPLTGPPRALDNLLALADPLADRAKLKGFLSRLPDYERKLFEALIDRAYASRIFDLSRIKLASLNLGQEPSAWLERLFNNFPADLASQITALNLAGCGLEFLPGIYMLTALEKIDLSRNLLKHYPFGYHQRLGIRATYISHDTVLILSGNPFGNEPPSVRGLDFSVRVILDQHDVIQSAIGEEYRNQAILAQRHIAHKFELTKDSAGDEGAAVP